MNQPSDTERFTQLLTGYWLSQAIYVAAELNIADQLHEKPRSADELADAAQVNSSALYRVLRALASVGIFEEAPDGTFRLTPMAELLRDGVPGSQRAVARMVGQHHYASLGELLYSVQTGLPSFDKVFGMPIFDYLSQNSEAGRTFDRAMTDIHGRETEPMIDVYDFSAFDLLIDVGGGNGSLLSAVLRRNPSMRGIVYDLPAVVERTRDNLKTWGLDSRCEAIGGDFFQSVPEGGDGYLLRHIIHDWDDERSATILRNCHRAMQPGKKLLIVESVIPSGNDPHFGKLLDLVMLTIPGGKERTADEFRELLNQSGFELSRIIEMPTGMSILEAVKES